MGNAQKTPDRPSVWIDGLSINDFLVPSAKTAPKVAAEPLTVTVIDTEECIRPGPVFVAGEAVASSFSVDEAAQWGAASNNLTDWVATTQAWPFTDPASYRPDASVQVRIEDNLAAIRLLSELRAANRGLTHAERATLLKYCGWGGLARIFAPDGSSRQPLADQRDELAQLVTQEEFASMQASITSAYFTDPTIVSAMWAIAKQLGFEGGRVLEPTAGVGHFLAGMPAEWIPKSEITAVELDTISAGMLEALFGPHGVQVHANALEKTRLPVAFFDLVIGNVPFGKHKTGDISSSDFANWSIHNWMLAKSVDLVRPGGLVILITSRHSLDSATDIHRKWLSAHAELIAAYRLPTMAFRSQANTEAVTDIIVLKRRTTPNHQTCPWIHVAEAKAAMLRPGERLARKTTALAAGFEPSNGINSYYVQHPEHVLGWLEMQVGQFGRASLNPVFDGSSEELQDELNKKIALLPTGVYVTRKDDEVAKQSSAMQRYKSRTFVSPGTFVLQDERICVAEGDELLDVDTVYNGMARKRIIGMMEIRDCVNAVVAFQATSQDDVELGRLQRILNQTYDEYVAAMGYLFSSANARLMRSDPSWPLMLALEVWDDEEETATKADIFFKRTVGHKRVPETVDNVKDAMLISLSEFGQIVLADIAKRTCMPVMQVVKELTAQSLAFRDPELCRWVPADEYLSGHIRDKIVAAKAAGAAYVSNVVALEAVLPKDLSPSQVEARLGAPWIPCDVIEQFARELVEAADDAIEVKYETHSATWTLKCASRMEWVGNSTLQMSQWGTSKRCALTLLEGALNQVPPSVTKLVDGKSVVDRMATLAAREKWQQIRDHFRAWIYKDYARRDKLLQTYNSLFNQIVERKYDGSHLSLPGMTTTVTPYGHQLDSIWRIVVGGNTLLWQAVGAGKTLEMCAAAMELRRLGKAVKPLHVVQNSCLEQYTAELVRLYPQAKVLMASKDDVHGDKRRTFVSRAALGDFDSIVMTQSTFERLALSPAAQREFILKLLDEARLALAAAENSGAKRSLKEIEKRMKDLQARLERLAAAGAKDGDSIWFDELGVDYILCDESHSVKNLARISKMPRIAGLPNAASNRAFDFFMKTRIIMDQRGGREEGVVMASATQLTSSLAELHVAQVLLQPMTLKRLGLYEFDAWSASFGESVTGIEMSPDGAGYRVNTRYCRFVNVPELMAIFRCVADIRTKKMLNLPTPRIEGGKPLVKVSQPSEELLAIVQDLVERAELIRSHAVKPNIDNMLKVTNTGRLAALDVRLVNPGAAFDPNGKLAVATDNMVRIWNENHDMRATQLVFSDLGTPGSAKFNVYAEVKRLLIEKGVPAAEIEFIHDHESDSAKAKIHKKVNEGAVRFLLGSTSKLGTGTNVQRRLKAIHQLDAPWVPSSVEQRDGRADRQGNLNETIELWRYVTERSFDAYSWNLLNVKAQFIEQIMTAESGLRSVEDVAMTTLSYAEIRAIASGNPMVIEKAGIDTEVQRLTLLRSQWEDERWSLSRRESSLLSRLTYIDSNMAAAEKDAARAEKELLGKPMFVPCTTVGQSMAHKFGNGASGLAGAFRAHSNLAGRHVDELELGTFGGFAAQCSKSYGEPTLYLVGPHTGQSVRVHRPHMNDIEGVGAAAVATIAHIAKAPAAMREEYGQKSNELATVRSLIGQEFDQAEKLDTLLKRQREIESELDLDKDVAGTDELPEEAN